MSKTMLLLAASAAASVSASTAIAYLSHKGSIPPDGLLLLSVALAVPPAVGLLWAVLMEAGEERKARLRDEEGRRYAARSDAEFRNRRQDPAHLAALEEALAG
mgnify:CR=1 FL=1